MTKEQVIRYLKNKKFVVTDFGYMVSAQRESVDYLTTHIAIHCDGKVEGYLQVGLINSVDYIKWIQIMFNRLQGELKQLHGKIETWDYQEWLERRKNAKRV